MAYANKERLCQDPKFLVTYVVVPQILVLSQMRDQ